MLPWTLKQKTVLIVFKVSLLCVVLRLDDDMTWWMWLVAAAVVSSTIWMYQVLKKGS